MNFTKITPAKKPWQNIITEDMNTAFKTAVCKIDRFSIYQLKILNHNCTDGKLIAFMIIGNEAKGEKSLMFLEFQHGVVVKYVFQIGRSFDSELTKYLGFAFIMRLKAKGTFAFLSSLFPLKK